MNCESNDSDNYRLQIPAIFKMNGLSVDFHASKELCEFLDNHGQGFTGSLLLKRVVDTVLKMDLNSTIISHQIMCNAIGIVERDMYSCRGDMVKVYDASSIPFFKFDPKTQKFSPVNNEQRDDDDDCTIPDMFFQRLSLIRKRMNRHTLFFNNGQQSLATNSNSELRLVKVEAILSGGFGSVGEQRYVVIGSLIDSGEHKISIEDETGVVLLTNIENANIHAGFYCENVFVLVEGTYANGQFKVSAIGLPPPEPISMIRKTCACTNYLSNQESVPVWANERLIKLEKETSDCMIVFMSDVRLDKEKVIEKLEIMFEKYNSANVLQTPASIVLCGDFIDPQIKQSLRMDAFKDAMDLLWDLLTKHEKLYKECRFVLVPGPNDPGPPLNIYPRFPNLSVTDLASKQKRIDGCNGSELKLCSNPVWITFCSQTFVVFRYDLTESLLANSMFRPKNDNNSLHLDVVRTVLSQSHMLPIPQQLCSGPKANIVPSLDHTLRLYPCVPDVIILADKHAFYTDNIDVPSMPLVINPMTLKNKKSKRAKSEFGNYYGYYGYRNPNGKMDPRLDCLSVDYFARKRILDIGCNDGSFTIEIAKRFDPLLIIGIDIDSKLVRMARKKLLLHSKTLTEIPFDKFPSNVYFREENYMESTCSMTGRYDCVLALSVSKWIHVNYGDDGLLEFFKRLSQSCKLNGSLIAEFQPWTSYKMKKSMSHASKSIMTNIKLRPEQFVHLLVNRFGFVLEAEHQPNRTQKGDLFSFSPQQNVQRMSTGFQREIQILRKRYNIDFCE